MTTPCCTTSLTYQLCNRIYAPWCVLKSFLPLPMSSLFQHDMNARLPLTFLFPISLHFHTTLWSPFNSTACLKNILCSDWNFYHSKVPYFSELYWKSSFSMENLLFLNGKQQYFYSWYFSLFHVWILCCVPHDKPVTPIHTHYRKVFFSYPVILVSYL